jgi:hypothetical protein
MDEAAVLSGSARIVTSEDELLSAVGERRRAAPARAPAACPLALQQPAARRSCSVASACAGHERPPLALHPPLPACAVSVRRPAAV